MIEKIQLDLNGYCNANCWYCPVRYEPLPKYTNMSIKNVEIILDKISKYQDNVFIYTSHYNEILLYPYLEDFFKLLKERKILTMILSNGINISPKKLDLLIKYSDVIGGLNLNIPTIDKESWINQVGLNKKEYNKLIINLDNIHKNFKEEFPLSIGMNGISKKWVNGWMGKMAKFPEYINDNTLNEEFIKFKEKYPKFSIFKSSWLIDRNNLLEKNEIYSLRYGNLIQNKKSNTKIIGCTNTGNRFDEWLHINSFGNVFILEQSLEEIWNSDKRQEIIKKAKNNICQTCLSAVWE